MAPRSKRYTKDTAYKKRKDYIAKVIQGKSYAKNYRRVYGKIYFLISEYVAKNEGKPITFEQRDEILEKIKQYPECQPINGDTEGSDRFVERAFNYALGNAFVMGDVPSARIKQTEVLEQHHEIIEKAIERGDLKTARDANQDLLKVYRVLGNDQDGGRSLVALSEHPDGSKKMLMSGTSEELISVIKQAIQANPKESVKQNIRIEDKKEEYKVTIEEPEIIEAGG